MMKIIIKNDMEDRRSGKTTRLMEEAIALLGELPEDCFVFITGPHSRWLFELERAFRDKGLFDVKFLTISQIKRGNLRGRKGRLLIDDFHDLALEDREILLEEKKILRNTP